MRKTVAWKGFNEMPIEDIISMGEDGYEFTIRDGSIAEVKTPPAA